MKEVDTSSCSDDEVGSNGAQDALPEVESSGAAPLGMAGTPAAASLYRLLRAC